MPKKIQNTTKANLVSVPLPNHGTTYTVISHQFVIDYAYQSLAAAGFDIVDEEYRCTADGQIAQGIYKLNFNNDPELSMMFAWTNSYNKQVKFKCVVGAYINNSGSVMISGEVASWVRKHTGTADTEVKDTIDTYISNAYMYYNQLCSDKVAMEVVSLNKRKQSQLLGVLFAEYEILTTEQASMIRDQMKRPQQVFKNTDSLWAFYNFVTNALQSSHPKTWMEDQRILHYFIGTICDFSTPPQPLSAPVINLSAPVEDPLYEDPNQTNILDQIAEAEAEEKTFSQMVQEDPEMLEIAHQVDEILGTLDEAEEVPFDIDADDDAVLDALMTPIAPCAAHDTETEREIQQENLEDIFPSLKIDEVELNETTKIAVIVTETKSLEPTPEEHELFEEEEISPWDDDEEVLAPLIEPAQDADLSIIEAEDPDAFDLDFTEDSSTDNSDFDF